MKELKVKKAQRGIGLLELMLALAITAILIIVSVQYFQSTKNSTFVNAAVQEVQTIISATNGLTAPAQTADCSESGDCSSGDENTKLTQAIILSGSLPEEYIQDGDDGKILTTPWGSNPTKSGQFTVGFVNDDKPYFQINGIGLPNYGCKSLASQFAGMANLVKDGQGEPDCDLTTSADGSTGDFTVKYYVSTGSDIDPQTP